MKLTRYPMRIDLTECWMDRPRMIYQYSNMDPGLSGDNYNFFKFPLSFNSQKRLWYKENTKYRSLSRKPQSHVRILNWYIERRILILLSDLTSCSDGVGHDSQGILGNFFWSLSSDRWTANTSTRWWWCGNMTYRRFAPFRCWKKSGTTSISNAPQPK